MEEQRDLLVIGAGPGGYVAAIRAAQLGLRTTVVERDQVGGVCLNWGCIPTKAMLRSAELLHFFHRAKDFGLRAENVGYEYRGILAYRDRVVEGLRNGVAGLLRGNGVELIRGEARLLSRDTVEVRGADGARTVSARSIIIATGSRANVLPIPGATGRNVGTSDDLLRMQEPPRRLLIIGAGAIGAEWASIFQSLGTTVTIVEVMPTLVPLEDAEIGKALERAFTRRGIAVFTSTRVQEIADAPDGSKLVTLVDGEGRQHQVATDFVLMAVGRRPNSEGLGLERVGVRTDERGRIVVDDHQRTTVPGIYAIGDVSSRYLLAHVASHEGIVAAENVAGHDTAMSYKAVPACTFSIPEIASTGLTEAAAREQGYQVKVGRFPFTASAKAQIYGETEGFVKIVADATYGEVLGIHIIGPGASDIITEGPLALRLEATVESIAETIHAHPTLGEAVMEAALATLDRPLHVLRPRR